MTHDELVRRAEKWLKRQNCKVVIRDPIRAWTNEQPDAIGWRDYISILIECKATRADFLADKSKSFRKDPTAGMGDWRFYLCPAHVIEVDEIPQGWGLLWAMPKTVRNVHGVPSNASWYRDRPFNAQKRNETIMLISALRRLALHGYLPEIYEGLIYGGDHESKTTI